MNYTIEVKSPSGVITTINDIIVDTNAPNYDTNSLAETIKSAIFTLSSNRYSSKLYSDPKKHQQDILEHAENCKLSNIHIDKSEDTALTPYTFAAFWPNADNDYADTVFAYSLEDAELQAAIKMATLDTLGTSEVDNQNLSVSYGDIPEVLEFAHTINVHYVAKELFSFDDLVILLQKVYTTHQSGADFDELMLEITNTLEILDKVPEIPKNENKL